jgi:hypothetical protein
MFYLRRREACNLEDAGRRCARLFDNWARLFRMLAMNVDVSNIKIEKKPPEGETFDVMEGFARASPAGK